MSKYWSYEESLPEGSETITANLIARATLEGDAFQPQNLAQEILKKELADLPEGTVVDIPNDF